MQQLAYRVEDVEAVSATLRERGLRLLYDEPRRGTSGSRVNFVHPKDAGGVLIELVRAGGRFRIVRDVIDPRRGLEWSISSRTIGKPWARATGVRCRTDGPTAADA